jgi:hypothetical protein
MDQVSSWTAGSFSCYTAPDESFYFGVIYRGRTHVMDFYSLLTDSPTKPHLIRSPFSERTLNRHCFFFGISANVQ